MIEKSNLIQFFEELDRSLSSRDKKRGIIIYGGAALISLGFIDRATTDVDIFQPQIDKELMGSIREVGQKYLLDEMWMNCTGNAFIKELPQDWENRTTPVFKGEHLTVSSLGRVDLIFTKMLAELDRQEDLEDLIQLRPTQGELDQVVDPLLKLESSQPWKDKVRELIKILKDHFNA